jgi:hypothetical protein
MTKTCHDCHDGEHENYDNDVVLVSVINPDTMITFKRSLMCYEHRSAYCYDGYILKDKNGNRLDD